MSPFDTKELKIDWNANLNEVLESVKIEVRSELDVHHHLNKFQSTLLFKRSSLFKNSHQFIKPSDNNYPQKKSFKSHNFEDIVCLSSKINNRSASSFTSCLNPYMKKTI